MDLGDTVWYMERGILDLHELLEHADQEDVACVDEHYYHRLIILHERLGNCLNMIRDAKQQPSKG